MQIIEPTSLKAIQDSNDLKKIIYLVKQGIRKNIKSWLTESEEKNSLIKYSSKKGVDEFIKNISNNALITDKNIAVIVGIMINFKNLRFNKLEVKH